MNVFVDYAYVLDRDVGFWRPFCLLAQRGWREMTRNKQELCLKYCMNVAFSLLFGIIYFRMNHSQTSIQVVYRAHIMM